MPTAYYHGGKAGLDRGDVLLPAPPHVTDGCPICVARAEGRTMRVGEYRRWLRRLGPKAAPVLASLEGADDWEPIDPPSGREAVYVTTDVNYATWYAARSRGDLYRVQPIGDLAPSPEDHFPTWTVAEARVVEVVRRRVRLQRQERRALLRRWKKADAKAARRPLL
jgi:hypothetical protein